MRCLSDYVTDKGEAISSDVEEFGLSIGEKQTNIPTLEFDGADQFILFRLLK